MAQVLVKRRGTGRVAAREVLLANMAVRNLIREGRLAQIYSLMQAGGAAGMKTMDAALQQLRAEGVIETG
ncbi:Twitching mobility protein [compost metagenome]